MKIKVKTAAGKEIEIEIDPMDTINKIKERVKEKESIPPMQQRLIYTGKLLADDQTAKHYNIEDGSSIHLALANPSYDESDTACYVFCFVLFLFFCFSWGFVL